MIVGESGGRGDLAQYDRGLSVPVGSVTYLPIPVGGVCLLLFIIERIFLGAHPTRSRNTMKPRRSSDPPPKGQHDIFILLATMLICFLIGMPIAIRWRWRRMIAGQHERRRHLTCEASMLEDLDASQVDADDPCCRRDHGRIAQRQRIGDRHADEKANQHVASRMKMSCVPSRRITRTARLHGVAGSGRVGPRKIRSMMKSSRQTPPTGIGR